MRNGSALVATAAASVLLLATTLLAQDSDATSSSSPGVSKVRIVRLSEIKGHVQLDRNVDRGFEPAIANMPIVEKSRLQTGDGVAEIEFEDNSTLRVAPDSIVEFPQLERLADGGTLTTVHLVQGMAYVTLIKGRGNEFHLLFGEQNLALPTPSHIRLQLNGTEANLAVLDGSVRIEGTSGVMDIPKKKTVTFDLLEHQKPTLSKDVAPEAYDSWDQSSTGYHARVANSSAFSGSPYSYGLNDMQYYGSFVDAGGCGGGAGGMMWRPYFASAAWDPYSNGAWAYYQGAGYSWVSPYPWGWTPYHTGSWNFCPGMGWGWQPGGGWNGLNNIASMTHYQSIGGAGAGSRPPSPIHPPHAGAPTLVPVNTRPLVRSEVASPESFVFRKDSAGLGVPRDGFGKLDKVSQHAETRGVVNEHIYVSAPASAMPNGRVTNTAIMAGSIHRGSPPPSASPTYQGQGQSTGGYGSQGRSSGPSAPSMPSASAPSHASGGPSASAGSGSARSH
jgi:hypothetical protein